MTHLVFRFRDGTAYEVTDRHTRPYSSSARHYHHDPYYIRQLITWLPIENHDWRSLLQRISSQPLQFHSNHPGEIYDAAMQAVVRGDLRLYQLPRLGDTHCVPGANNTGLIFIRGPQPHAGTQQKPETIASPQAARQLLDDMAVNHKVLFHRLSSEGLYNSHQKPNPLNDLCQLLAKGDILVYKIPLRPPVKPPKPIEYEDTSGPQFQPVPLLAPEPEPRPAASNPPPTKPAQTAKPAKKAPPQSLEEAQQRLIDAGPAVRAAKAKGAPLPASSYTLEDKQAVIESGNTERYMVRVVDSDYVKDDGYIAQKRDHGATIGWMAPLTMVEHGDTDAEALLNAFGTRHDPTKSYTILIIDTHQMNAVADVQTIIPTNQNLQKLIVENPQISNVSPDITAQVLSEEFAPKYYKFAKGMAAEKVNQKDTLDMENFANEQGFSTTDSDLLLARHQLAKDVSAWEEFTGNGMTMDTNVKDKIAYGPVELVMLDKSPKTLGELKSHNAILSLAAS